MKKHPAGRQTTLFAAAILFGMAMAFLAPLFPGGKEFRNIIFVPLCLILIFMIFYYFNSAKKS